ncbi:hypothetical protein ABZ894_32280 [Nocardia beijingensis]|uniref:hypothetical protein n=1 Tax=Nocardia beijingensis TaxID=95162 RepID=UPI0033DD1408
MSDQETWEAFVVQLCDLAVTHDADTVLRESLVVLSSRTVQPGDRSGKITVTRFDDEAARVQTGWCFDMVVDYATGDRERPSPALRLVEAICAGNAEEQSLIDADGRWVDVFCQAWTPTGDRWTSGDPQGATERATRRFPRWNNPAVN